ncbi:MAG: hypothetical protein JWO19_2611 [Bryobacterales bacterium]|nr:hypothetical protein [Bryobacterales bacterium]
MTPARFGSIAILCGVLGTSVLFAGDLSSYRGLKLGMNLAAAAKQAGTRPADAKIVHQRPAVIQEMNWELRSALQVNPKPDPVRDGLLSFFNGELFRIIVTYDRYKVEGMTADDMIQAISATYGTATMPTAEIAYHSNYGEVAPVIARWEDAESSYDLVRTGDRASFAMILYSKRLDALAQAAIVESARLDAQEAPQREIERQKKRDSDERIVLDKARSVNRPNFRP